MFHQSPPDDHRVYGSYIRVLMTSRYMLQPDEWKFREWVEHIYNESIHVATMRNGSCTALELLVDLRLKTLQLGATTYHFPSCLGVEEAGITNFLEKRGNGGHSQFLNLATLCRRVRELMQARPCSFPDPGRYSNDCIYNVLVPDLDALQRSAYFEIRSNVQLALGTRLPAELAHMVFEHTLEAEGIASDPRIVVFAIRGKELHRKCRFPCEHDRRRVETPVPYFGPTLSVGYMRRYGYGPVFEEVLPSFPYRAASYCELQSTEMAELGKLRAAGRIDADSLHLFDDETGSSESEPEEEEEEEEEEEDGEDGPSEASDSS